MNENLIQQIQPLLEEVASKLGTSATQVWHWAIRQQYIDLVESIFALPSCSLVFGLLGKS